jgi:hypothetical protein
MQPSKSDRRETIRTNKIFASLALVALATLGLMPAPASAQLANASASTLGLSGNNTATVRGFGAISVNPAGLAMPGSGFSLAFLPLQIRSGLDPVSLSDLADFDGTLVPNSTKQTWLDAITVQGSQTGPVGVDLSEIALTFGSIGLQVSTVGSAAINLPAGMMEALLFGNAGRTGSATNLDLAGASVDAYAMTTAGISFGIPFNSATDDMAIGATVKYTVGHVLAIGRGSGSVQADPTHVSINFPMVHSCDVTTGAGGIECDDIDPFGGTGIGLDLGFMMKQDRFSLGVSATNVVNTFEWDAAKLAYRPGSASFDIDDTKSNFDPEAYSGAPTSLRTAVDDLKFKPAIRVGGALDLSDHFTVSGDLHSRFSDDGIALSPKFHLGAGAEFRGLKVLHLRGGAAVITDGVQYSGGASLVLGPLNVSTAFALQTGDLGENALAQAVISFGGR